jgi:hypothetical protein
MHLQLGVTSGDATAAKPECGLYSWSWALAFFFVGKVKEVSSVETVVF